LLVVMALAFTAIAARLTVVQGLSWRQYADLGASQRLRRVQLPAERGSVLDRNGAELAMTMSQRTVWANPKLVTDPAAEARALAPVLTMDEGQLRDRLSSSTTFTYLARKVDDAVADRVAALRLPGISFLQEPKRFQPSGDLAATLLGQVGVDNQGLTGLELQFEPRLKGSPGELLVERDPTGREIAAGVRQHRASKRGDDLVLTIDRALQYETEQALASKIQESAAKGGTAIVMDPRSGEVLAMASLVAGANGAPAGPAANNLGVTSVYEPGSVNKVITIAGALEEGVIRPADKFVVPDRMTVGGSPFVDHDRHPPKNWTVTDIVANSSNIGTIMIGRDLGKQRLDRYLRAFGLGTRTALDFPGESAGLLIAPNDWSGPSIGTVPIGQGLAVTALQMLGAYNTVANGGTYVAPKLVRRTVDTHGVAHETKPSPHRRVVSTRTAQQVTAMLTEVTRVGTGTEAQIKGYSVAGKTGTANKPKEGGGGYQEGAYVATFAGFVPAEAPRLSAIVVLDEPTHGYYGGKVAAPTFAEVVRYALRLLRVPPPALAPVVAVPPLVDPSTKDLDVVPPPPSTTVPPTTVPPASVPTQTTVPAPTTVPAARPTTLAAFPSPPVRP
jgi:cell division protein FtsI (penicillin-binding protein 3)